MEHDSPPQREWTWNEMLEAFCALGGAAQNVALGNGEFGCGLSVVDPREPVLLRVSRNLLFRVDDIEFTAGSIGIRESADVPDTERRFFERYQTAFSWGAGGQAKATSFIAALEGLPPETRELLIAEFRLGHLLQGDFATRIWTHFLQTREVPWRGGAVIAPLLELANHSADGLQYERGMHLQVQGYVRQDIALRYGAEDAYSVFCRFGVLEPRPAAFSLSGRVQLEDKEIVIGRNTEKSVKRGKHRVPKTGIDGNTLTLSYLLLGHRQVPRLARGIFGTLLGEAGVTNPDEVFDYILRSNALKFIKLLKTLEPHEGEMVSMLRAMARHQLESMNHCIGNRPLGLASVPLE